MVDLPPGSSASFGSSADGELALFVSRISPEPDDATVESVLAERHWEDKVRSVVCPLNVGLSEYQFAEAMAPPTMGVEPDRTADLLSVVNSMSEKLALALAAGNELAICQKQRLCIDLADQPSLALNEVRARAWADTYSYYLLGTGQSLAAATLRVLGLEIERHSALQGKFGHVVMPFSDRREDYPSLDQTTCKRLRQVAAASSVAAIQEAPIPVSCIYQSDSWRKVNAVRGTDYHRLRPRSGFTDGAPNVSPWKIDSDGTRTIEVGTDRYTDLDDRAAQVALTMFQLEEEFCVQLPIFDDCLTRLWAELQEKYRRSSAGS